MFVGRECSHTRPTDHAHVLSGARLVDTSKREPHHIMDTSFYRHVPSPVCGPSKSKP